MPDVGLQNVLGAEDRELLHSRFTFSSDAASTISPFNVRKTLAINGVMVVTLPCRQTLFGEATKWFGSEVILG